ncbi:hypothetical protein [Paracoccus cavernae]|uniref:hypothetical protein n=1 Tax=Paracoccus cavernae TaxID=1571207 RepID=UPI00362CDED4
MSGKASARKGLGERGELRAQMPDPWRALRDPRQQQDRAQNKRLAGHGARIERGRLAA